MNVAQILREKEEFLFTVRKHQQQEIEIKIRIEKPLGNCLLHNPNSKQISARIGQILRDELKAPRAELNLS